MLQKSGLINRISLWGCAPDPRGKEVKASRGERPGNTEPVEAAAVPGTGPAAFGRAEVPPDCSTRRPRAKRDDRNCRQTSRRSRPKAHRYSCRASSPLPTPTHSLPCRANRNRSRQTNLPARSENGPNDCCSLCSPRARDVEGRGGVLHFRILGKRGRIRYIPINPLALRLIDEYLEMFGHREERDSALFRPVRNNHGGGTGHPLNPDSLYRNVICHYGRRTGLDEAVSGLCVHSTRATAATDALEHGARSGSATETCPPRGFTTVAGAAPKRAPASRFHTEGATSTLQASPPPSLSSSENKRFLDARFCLVPGGALAAPPRIVVNQDSDMGPVLLMAVGWPISWLEKERFWKSPSWERSGGRCETLDA